MKDKPAPGFGFVAEQPNDTSDDGNTTGNEKDNKEPALVANTTMLDTPEGVAVAKSRVILTWREQESYEAANLYPFVKNVMVPDMTFQLGPFAPIRPPLADDKTTKLMKLITKPNPQTMAVNKSTLSCLYVLMANPHSHLNETRTLSKIASR